MMLRILAAAFALLCTSSLGAFAQSDFRVTLLGTGNPVPSIERFGPSTLVEVAGQALIFDAGRGVTIRLGQVNRSLLGKITALFVTHYHSDHVVGIPDIWLTGWLLQRRTPLHVIGPTGAKNLMNKMSEAYKADVDIRKAQGVPMEGGMIKAEEFDKDGVVYEKDGVKVTAFEVDHGAYIKPAFGYKIEYGGRSVVLSGDTRYSQNLIKYGAGADLLIHEVAYLRSELKSNLFMKSIMDVHTTPYDTGRIFAQTKPKLAVYSHIVSLYTDKVPELSVDDAVKETRETYGGPLEVGEDLTSFEIGSTIAVHRRRSQ